MKNIFKSIFVLAGAAFMAVSCNVDFIGQKYSAADAGTAGVSFLQKVVSDTELPANTTSYDITIGRSSTDAAATVNIQSTLPAGICPSTVTFAAGQSSANITLDLSNVSVGTLVKGALTLADQPDYANSKINVSLQKAYKWAHYGTVKLTDGLVCSVFTALSITWEVEADKAEGFEVYRLIDPYGEAYPYNDPGDWKNGVKWVFDATNPNKVTFERTYLGFDWGYGEFNVYLLDGGEGKMVNKVITFPAKGMVFDLPDYGSFYGNAEGNFKLDLNL